MKSWLHRVVLLAGCLAAACEPRALHDAVSHSAPSADIDRARETLRQKLAGRLPAGATIAGVPLDGYNFATELQSGDGLRLLLISCNKSGGILGYRADGSLAFQKPTHEIIAVSEMDLDSDGRAELVLDQLDGVGTGLQRRDFHVYRITGDAASEVWSGISWEIWWPPFDNGPRPAPERRRSGFLQAVSGGFRHVVRDERTGKWDETLYDYRHGRVTAAKP